MKTTARLVIALAVIFLTTSKASAHGRMRHGYMAPMAGYSMPVAPMMFPPVLPLGLPAFGGGAGFSMSMSMQGDASMIVMLPLLFRLVERIFSPGTATGEGDLRTLLERLAGAGGVDPVLRDLLRALAARTWGLTEDLIRKVMQDEMECLLPRIIDTIRKQLRPGEGRGDSAVMDFRPSPELERARAEVRREVAALEAMQKEWAAPVRVGNRDPQSPVRRELAEIEALQKAWSAPAEAAKANPRAEIERQLAEIEALHKAWKARGKAGVTVSSK